MTDNPQKQTPPARAGFDEASALVKAHDDANESGASAPSPDLGEAQRFLDSLDPTGSKFRFRTFSESPGTSKGGGRKYHGTLAEVASALKDANRAGCGVYVVSNAGGDTDDEVTRIRAVFADCDEAGKPFGPVMGCGLPPHFVIETSPCKWHAWWFVTGLPVDQFRGVQRRIACEFGTDRSVINESRVMRLPGFYHRKGEPFLVRVINESAAAPYTAAQVLAAFPPLDKYPDKAKAASPPKALVTGASQQQPVALSPYLAAALRSAAENVANAPVGTRNNTLNTEAYSLAGLDGLTDTDIIEALAPAARDAGLDYGEIDATLASAIRSGRAKPRDEPSAAGNPSDEFSVLPGAPYFTLVDPRAETDTDTDFLIDPYAPRGVVTLLGGHGGAGKTHLALILAAHVAVGRMWGGVICKKGRVAFVTMEDSGARIVSQLKRICAAYGLDFEQVIANLDVLDGSGSKLPLAEETQHGRLERTAAYDELMSRPVDYDLIFIDNASDAFEGNENDRRQVRKFMRGLLGDVAREYNCAVVLLAHIDKAAARNGSGGNSYSGSTAWNNSARSRLALIPRDDGSVELAHEKLNVGKVAPTLVLRWSNRGVLHPSQERGDENNDAADADDVLSVIRLAIDRGESVPTKRTGPRTPHSLLKTFAELPSPLARDGKRFLRAIDQLLQERRIEVEHYKQDYKDRTRFRPVLTVLRAMTDKTPPMNSSLSPPIPPCIRRAGAPPIRRSSANQSADIQRTGGLAESDDPW